MNTKRILALLLALALMGCALTACGKKAQKSPKDAPATSEASAALDLNRIYSELLAAQEGVEEPILFEMTDDEMDSIYPGLRDIAVKQRVAFVAPIPGAPSEIVLLEVSASEDLEKVQKLFQTRIDQAGDSPELPEESAQWKANAKIETNGNYIGMIVLPDGYTIPDDVFTAFGG